MLKKSFLILLLCTSITTFSFQKEESKLDSILQKVELSFKNQQFKELISYPLDSLSIKNTNDSLLVSKIYHTKANAFYNLENYLKAVTYYNLATKIAPNNSSGKNILGTALYDKAFAEYELKEYVLSYKTVKKAEEVLSKISNPNYDYLLSIYADLGSEASYLGFYEEAEFYLNKGYAIFKNKLNFKDIINSNQASKKVLFQYKYIYLYHLKGDEKKMLHHFKNLEKLKKATPFNTTEKLMYAASLNCIGDFYLNFREKFSDTNPLQKGNYYINLALKNIDKKEYFDNYLQFEYNKAKQLRYSKKYAEALKLNQKIINLSGEKDSRFPFFIAQKGLIFLDQGNPQKALIEFNKMVAFIHSDSLKLDINYQNFVPSTVLNHTGLLVEIADEILEKYPKDTLVLKNVTQFYKMGLLQLQNCYKEANFNTKIKNYYHKTIEGIIKTKKLGFGNLENKKLINAIENLENRFSWKEFLQNRKLLTSSIPDAVFYKEAYLRSQLVAARKNNDKNLIAELNNKIEKHLSFLEEEYPSISNYIYKDFKVEDLQKQLKNNATVFRFKRIGNNFHVFKIDKKSVNLKTIAYSKELKNNIYTYIKLLKNSAENKQLAKSVLGEILPFNIQNFEHLIIIPDDILHHLPFETLVTKDDNYLVGSKTISYASYLVFVNSQNPAKKQFDKIQVFSPTYTSVKKESLRNEKETLEGALKEAEFISTIFDVTHFSGQKASKQNFMQNAFKADIIHLASHAKINHKTPELSYFSFSNDDSAKMYLEELYGLKLNANLAVLSACNTGTAKLNENIGVVSLQRAFRLAGVNATISSLWEVPDATTKEIMISFYKNLKLGMTKAKALQKAKQEYLANTNDVALLAPYYWAGFVVSGDTSAIIEPKNYSLFKVIVPAISIILIFGIWLFFKKFQQR